MNTCFVVLLFLGIMSSHPLSCDAQSVEIYTPYTKISVPPGESISYDIDLINNSKVIANAAISVTGLPKGWTYTMKSGGWSIDQVSVLPKERKTFSLQVQVPLQVNKGTYHFMVNARGLGQLPLAVVVSQKGTFKTEFTTGQANMQGAANSTFTYTANLRNGTSADQVYSLNAQVPPGWNVNFKADYKQVSSVSVEANKTKDITIEVDPPDQMPAGAYKIPILASTNGTSANLTLDLVITGSYNMELTTPSGLLSTNLTAGDHKRVELAVKNTGSATLKNIDLQAAAPTNWDISFEPNKIEALAPGNTVQVFATIKADEKAIAGDYVASMEAKTPEVSSKADFRVSALTSIAVWLFFTVFYQMIISLISKVIVPSEGASPQEILRYQEHLLNMMRLVPSQLFSDATTTLLMPSVRSLGPLTMEQVYGAIPSPLSLTQSLLLVWPQLTGLIAATILCFALSYFSFMRKEIRAR